MNYYRRIGIIATLAIGIAAMMIPGGSLVSTAFASGSSADSNTQSNSASNFAPSHFIDRSQTRQH